MLSYVTVGSNDIEAAKRFYDALLGSIGMKPMLEHQTGGRIYGSPDRRMFGVLKPFDGEAASPGNGAMVGFAFDSPEKMSAFHALVLELGGSCEGAPGLRGPAEYGNYAAYARDLDGNKLCALCMKRA